MVLHTLLAKVAQHFWYQECYIAKNNVSLFVLFEVDVKQAAGSLPPSASQAWSVPTGAWELPGELVMLRETVARFMEREARPVEERQPHDAYRLPDGDLARLQEKAGALGLRCLASPSRFGGGGLGLLARVIIAEEAAKCRMGAYVPAGGAFGFDPPRRIETRAARDGSDYVINGTKMWITGAGDADWGLVFARTGEAGRGDAIMEVVSASCCSTMSIRGPPSSTR